MAHLIVSRAISDARVRSTYVALALATFVVGLSVHFYGDHLHPSARDVMGDILWAAMIVWWVSAIAPRRSLLSRGTTALAICFAVELSQLFHTPGLDQLRNTAIGQLTLGTGFDSRDLVAYGVGVLAAIFLERTWFDWRGRTASRRYQVEMSARLPLKRVAASSDSASWILPRLHRFGLDVGSIVPDGFEAYARVFHPPFKHTADGKVEVRWAEIAAANGRSVEEELMLFDSDPTQLGASGERLWDEQSHSGSLSLKIAERLVSALSDHTKRPEKCWFALWEGWGDIDGRWPAAPRVHVPQREMLLFEGPIADVLETFSSVDWSYQSANLWWPDDRAWCVATEVDAEWTYVGGSRECISQLLSDPMLEAYPVTPTTIR